MPPVQVDLIGYNKSSCNKKRKRWIGDKVFRFKSFGEYGYPAEGSSSSSNFLENVKALVEYGQVETISSDGSPTSWSFQLEISRHPPLYILLFVVEESIHPSTIPQSCNHCVYVGWAENLICNKKYHFLLPLSEEISVSTTVNWVNAAANNNNNNYNYLGDMNMMMKGGGINRRQQLQQGGGQGQQAHAMHGVFHSNGFGHLLSINGLEMGSKLSGSQIMDFWDRLCTGLRARKVSVNDVSKKRGMELRLLHGVAYGEPWFGRWGYVLGRGSYGVTHGMYMKALEAVRTMPLLLLTKTTNKGSDDDVPMILSRYQTLSNHSLVSVGDLFHLMLHYKSQLPKDQNSHHHHHFNLGAVSMEASSRWSMKRIEMATEVIVEALKRVQFRWISRQEVRDMARAYIGDTGLLDFVLKSLGNHIVGNFLVRRCLNPVTKVLEYCLEDISSSPSPSCNSNSSEPPPPAAAAGGMRTNRVKTIITRVQLMRDVLYLYKSIFGDAKMQQQQQQQQQQLGKNGCCTMPHLASRMILDSKYLMKDYTNNNNNMSSSSSSSPSGSGSGSGSTSALVEEGDVIVKLGRRLKKVYCSIRLVRNKSKEVIAPYECILVEENATMDEVKEEAERRFRELYWGMRRLVVESVLVEEAAGNKIVLNMMDEDDDNDSVVGVGGTMNISEGGGARMNCVDCCCGTKEDDGERMVCCDICEVRQHTRCLNIPDHQQVPLIFLCNHCDQQILLLSPDPDPNPNPNPNPNPDSLIKSIPHPQQLL